MGELGGRDNEGQTVVLYGAGFAPGVLEGVGWGPRIMLDSDKELLEVRGGVKFN